MTITLNAFELARSIGDHPDAFQDVKVEVQKAVLAVVVSLLKSRAIDVAKLRTLHDAIGAQSFRLVLEHIDPKPLSAIVSKVDPHHPEQKAAQPVWHRSHLIALAEGEVAPVSKPERQSPPRAGGGARAQGRAPRKVTEENFYPASMTTAVRKGKKAGG